MKRPAFQFYPGDWRKDVALRSCSIAARGLWMDLLCIAHECEPYGYLVVNGRPMTAAGIANQVGLSPSACSKLLEELLVNGVARKTPEGVIYSKRMVEDEELRNKRAEGGKAGSEHGSKGAEHGKKGGRPKKPRGDEGPSENPPPDGARGVSEPPSEPPPSSSSSSSSSNNPQSPQGGGVGGEEPPAPTATPAGLICKALKAKGIGKVAPGNQLLAQLLEAGATEAEFTDLVETALTKGDPFAWILATVLKQRQRAAEMAKDLHRGPMPKAGNDDPFAGAA